MKMYNRLWASLLLVVLSNYAFAQVKVEGQVTDAENNEPLPGALIQVKGTNTVKASDFDGNFTIEVAEEGTMLEISVFGYLKQEVAAQTGTKMKVSMSSDVIGLEEHVIVALGMSKEKRQLGYAVQSLSTKDVAVAKEPNVMSSLSGKISGVSVINTSGQVGASSKVVLRGPKSISGSADPLYIVDGVPMDNGYFGSSSNGSGFDYGSPIADLNPDDIESMSVLKGPNAAALYGSRARNGAIVITTKSGKGASKGLGVTYTANASMETPLKLPDFQNEYSQGGDGEFTTGYDYSWGEKMEGQEVDHWWGTGPLNPQPNNVRDFFQTGRTMSNSLAVSGANDMANARFSYTNFNQRGTVENTYAKRDVLNLHSGIKLSDRLSVTSKVTYTRNRSNRTSEGYNIDNPMQQFLWGNRNMDIERLREQYEDECGNNVNWNTQYHSNPFWITNKNSNPADRNRINGYLSTTYEINDWLSAMARVGQDFYTEARQRIHAKGTASDADGKYVEENVKLNEFNADFLLTANRSLNENLDLTVTAGGNKRIRKTDFKTAYTNALELKDFYSFQNAALDPVVTQYRTHKVVNSLYATATLDYKGYLTLDLTGRNDWSSALPMDNNSYFYPSANLSLVYTDLFEGPSWLDFGKLRTSLAKVGNDTGPYQLQDAFVGGSPFQGVTPFTFPTTKNNNALVPEETVSFEIGTELKFFQNRLGVDVTYYTENTKNQIIAVQASSTSGYPYKWINNGEITNNGIEVMVYGKILQSKDGLNWTMDINYSKNNNLVKSLPEGLESITLGGLWSHYSMVFVDQPYGVIYGPGYVYDDAGNKVIGPDGVPLNSEPRIIGSTQADWRGGIRNSFSYKGVNFGFLIDGRFGGVLYSGTHMNGMSSGVLDGTLVGREEAFVVEGVQGSVDADGNVTTTGVNDVEITPTQVSQWGWGYYSNLHWGNTESNTFDATYIKLREMTLGYSFPKAKLGKFIQGASVAIYGRNLAILHSNVPHIDPEVSFGGGSRIEGMELGPLPSNKSFGVNLQLNF